MDQKQYQKVKDKILYKGEVNNPIKENLKKGFRFLKLFWVIILLIIIILLLYFFGDKLGIELWNSGIPLAFCYGSQVYLQRQG
jgi:acyl-ACP thioesterase